MWMESGEMQDVESTTPAMDGPWETGCTQGGELSDHGLDHWIRQGTLELRGSRGLVCVEHNHILNAHPSSAGVP